MILNYKWLTVPFTNRTRSVEVVRMWEVRWRSRHGRYSGDTRPELECFTSEAEAAKFAESLRAAFALIKHSSETTISIEQSSS
jgi:hypothetical protein